MNDWIALEITVDALASEAIESAINQLGSLGTEINLLPIQQPRAQIVVIGYFDEKPDEDDLRFQISDSLRIFGYDQKALKKIAWRSVKDRDWLAEWKKHWKATEAGKFIIAPPWENVGQTDKIVIRIEPNMAFGTGTHETTRLCLEGISQIYRPEQTFLDVGTGTGILAIAAAKLARENAEKTVLKNQNLSGVSAAKILACDTDADSVRIARENAIANGVGEDIEFFDGSINELIPIFDFVCANLTTDVIVPLLPLLIEKTRSVLLLSGILLEQKETIDRELNKFQIPNSKFEIAGEWISVIVNR